MFVFIHFWSTWSKLNTKTLNIAKVFKTSEDKLALICYIGRQNRFFSYILILCHLYIPGQNLKCPDKIWWAELTIFNSQDTTINTRTKLTFFGGLSWPFSMHRTELLIPGQNWKCPDKLCIAERIIFSHGTQL